MNNAYLVNTVTVPINTIKHSNGFRLCPTTLPETKGKWCIPALGILNNIYENDKIDAGLEKIGLDKVSLLLWASTEASVNEGWIFSKNSYDKNEIFKLFEKDEWFTRSGNPIGNFAIRPVIEF